MGFVPSAFAALADVRDVEAVLGDVIYARVLFNFPRVGKWTYRRALPFGECQNGRNEKALARRA
jgi:hypothetical protein